MSTQSSDSGSSASECSFRNWESQVFSSSSSENPKEQENTLKVSEKIKGKQYGKKEPENKQIPKRAVTFHQPRNDVSQIFAPLCSKLVQSNLPSNSHFEQKQPPSVSQFIKNAKETLDTMDRNTEPVINMEEMLGMLEKCREIIGQLENDMTEAASRSQNQKKEIEEWKRKCNSLEEFVAKRGENGSQKQKEFIGEITIVCKIKKEPEKPRSVLVESEWIDHSSFHE